MNTRDVGAAPHRRVSHDLATDANFRLGLGWQQAFALHFFTGQFASAPNRFRFLASSFLRRLLIMATKLHFAKDAFALHFFLERLERLIDIVVANENLHSLFLAFRRDRALDDRKTANRARNGAPVPCRGGYQRPSAMSSQPPTNFGKFTSLRPLRLPH